MIIPFLLTLVFFFWGARLFDQHRHPPRGRPADQRHRPAVDVEVPASGRPVGDRQPACAGRPAGRDPHDLAGRDPRALHPGAAHPEGGAARPLHGAVVQGRPAGHLPPVLLGILRHRPFGDGRPAHHHDAGRLPDLARRQSGSDQTLAAAGEALFTSYGCSGCHQGSSTVAGARRWPASTASRCRSRRAAR